MEELTSLIKDFFNNDKKFHTKEELHKKLHIKGEKQTNIFNDALKKLVEDGSLFFDYKKGYRTFSNDLGLAFGKIEINKSGTGFVHTNDNHTIIIENRDFNGALNGDSVIVTSINSNRKDYYSGEIYKIVKRNTGKIICEVIGNGYTATLIPHNNFINLNLSLSKNQMKDLYDGELILLKVGTECFENEYTAEIVESLGHINSPDIDINLLAAEYNIPIKFSEQADLEAQQIDTEVQPDDLINRIDLRNEKIITIDCDDTKDRDDSVYVEKLPNGNYKLKTSISDVSHYIKRGSTLFEEIKDRSTSHYPNKFCIPMIPFKISNGICSLNENTDRLTKTVEVEINNEGKIVDINVYKSVINSKKAMKYSEVNKVLAGEMVKGYEDFINDLKLMKELSDLYDKIRKNRNCIDFDIPDIKINYNEKGEPQSFDNSGQGDAEKIIENLMIITNTAVATYYSWLPFIYRIHEFPDEKTVKDILKLLRISGFDIPKIKNINEKALVTILDKVKNYDSNDIIKTNLLMSMKRARYDINNFGHFALQLEKYCHFTSPIRRIADFMIHTLIDEIEKIDYSNDGITKLENEFKYVCKKASETEKIAQEFENEAKIIAMAEYMKKHIGEEFSAHIMKICKNGMLIKTNNNIIGKIKLENMLDDNYFFDNDTQSIIGKSNKKRYKLGDKIYVISKDACKKNTNNKFYFTQTKKFKEILNFFIFMLLE